MSDPQARAAEVLAAHLPQSMGPGKWPKCFSHPVPEDYTPAHVAAALAEAGLLADLETRRFGAIFDDLDAARAELTEVKAERDSHLAALVAQGRVTDRLTWELRDACDDRGAAWRAYEIALQTGAEWQTRAEQAETELAALREGVRELADEWRTAHGDPPVDPSHISVRHAERLLALIGDQP